MDGRGRAARDAPDRVPEMLEAGGTGRGEEESSFDVTAGISMVELEFAVVEFMISSLEGVYTPHQNGLF